MHRPLGSLAALLAVASLTATARAQPEPPEVPAAAPAEPTGDAAAAAEPPSGPAPADAAAPAPDAPAAEAPAAEPATEPAAAPKPALPPEAAEQEEKPPAEPPEPKAGTQWPDPVPEPERGQVERGRNVDLGPAAGIWWHPARDGGGVSYGAGFVWGGTVRTDIERWLGVRALVVSGWVPVTIDPGSIGPSSDTRVNQPDLELILMSLQAEPTWVVLPRLRLWAGLGLGWGTIVAPAPEAQGESIRSARRTGVLIEGTASLGGTVDVVPDLLTVSLLLGGSLIASQSGEVFEPVQALRQDPPATSIEYYDPLPELGGSLSGLLSVGLVL